MLEFLALESRNYFFFATLLLLAGFRVVFGAVVAAFGAAGFAFGREHPQHTRLFNPPTIR